MMGLSRRLDPRVEAALGEAAGERLLGWGTLAGGAVVVCTDQSIRFPDDRRVPWDLVIRASWSEEFLDLVVQSELGAVGEHVRLRFDQPGPVPAVVRERVEWSVVASQPVQLRHPDGRAGSAVLNARRSPQDGRVRWAVVFDRQLDSQDQGWRTAADTALSQLRAQLGV